MAKETSRLQNFYFAFTLIRVLLIVLETEKQPELFTGPDVWYAHKDLQILCFKGRKLFRKQTKVDQPKIYLKVETFEALTIATCSITSYLNFTTRCF